MKSAGPPKLALFGSSSLVERALFSQAESMGWIAVDLRDRLGQSPWEESASRIEAELGGFDAAFLGLHQTPEAASFSLQEAMKGSGSGVAHACQSRMAGFPFQLAIASKALPKGVAMESDPTVFGSRHARRCLADSAKDPRGVHGMSLASGEAAILLCAPKGAVVRFDAVLGGESLGWAYSSLREAATLAALGGDAMRIRPVSANWAARALLMEFSLPGGMRSGARHMVGPVAYGALQWCTELHSHAGGIDRGRLAQLSAKMVFQERPRMGLADAGPRWDHPLPKTLAMDLEEFGLTLRRDDRVCDPWQRG